MAAPRLFLHIGLQKTGTSYLQDVCWKSVEQLREQGLDLVPGTLRETFWLMLDVRGRYEAEFDPPEAGRAVDDLPGRLRASTTPRALVTEESLAPATDEQIRRLLAACGSHEVHVVVTVRDLARQVPSAWQQRLQGGGAETFPDYLRRLRRNEGSPEGRLWRQKDVPGILERWARHVPAERIHVVTVPPSGSPPGLLLQRFCEVFEVDPARLDQDVPRSNEALHHVAAEVLRRVNEGIDPELRRRDVYGAVGKRHFAGTVLDREAGHKVRMPVEHEEWCRGVMERHLAFLREGGFRVVGDLADLEPRSDSFSAEDPTPTEAEVAEVSTRALSDLLATQMTNRRRQRRRTPAKADRRRGWRALLPARGA